MGKALPAPAHYKLDVWKASMRLVKAAYLASGEFPEAEKYGLTSQLWLAKDLGFFTYVTEIRNQVLRILAMLNGLITQKRGS